MRSYKGFTLIELLVTLSVLAVLFGIASPSFKQLTEIKAKSMLQDIAHLSQLARQYAISSGSYATICPSDDSIHCSDDWQKPLMVFTDQNKNEKVDNNDQIIRVHQTDVKTLTLDPHFSLGKKYIQFNGRGFTNSTFGNISVASKNEPDTVLYKFIITRLGRVRLEKI